MFSFTIEELKPADLANIPRLQPASWGNIVPNTRFYIESNFCYAIKASAGGELLGTGAAIMHKNVAWLANIIVHPDARNHGIGTAITKHLLAFLQTRYDNIMLIATPLGMPIYEKFGFKTDGIYQFFHEGVLAGEAHPQLQNYSKIFRVDILNMDLQITGEAREQMLTPHLEQAVVYVDQTGVRGFCMPTLGEGLALADTVEAGLALMRPRLSTRKKTVVPVENKAAFEFLLQNGFEAEENRLAYRMYLGNKFPWNPEKIFGRVGGNVG